MNLGTQRQRCSLLIVVLLLTGILSIPKTSHAIGGPGDCDLQEGLCIYECSTLGGLPYDQCFAGCDFQYQICELENN